MKDYKVESLIYYSKLTLDSEHIAKKSKEDIQEKRDEYAKNEYHLAKTTFTKFGLAIYMFICSLKKIFNILNLWNIIRNFKYS